MCIRDRGWINYYAKYHRDEVYAVFYRLNILIRKWIKNTYKIRGLAKIFNKYQQIQSVNPVMFYHWTLGVRAWLIDKSLMRGDVHVGFCERFAGETPAYLLGCCAFLYAIAPPTGEFSSVMEMRETLIVTTSFMRSILWIKPCREIIVNTGGQHARICL